MKTLTDRQLEQFDSYEGAIIQMFESVLGIPFDYENESHNQARFELLDVVVDILSDQGLCEEIDIYPYVEHEK